MIQKYIHNPHLIYGRKYDLRVYALVTSINPLRVYLHDGSYVRITGRKYKPPSEDKTLMTHITNIHYQQGSGYDLPKSSLQTETRNLMKLSRLMEYYNNHFGNGTSKRVWTVLKRSITSVLLATTAQMRHVECTNCFQLCGVDVVWDKALEKAFVIEVNGHPGVSGGFALADGIPHSIMIPSALRMKGASPLVPAIDLAEFRKQLAENEIEYKEEFTSELGRMIQEYYYRGKFDLTWPLDSRSMDELWYNLTDFDRTMYHTFLLAIQRLKLNTLFQLKRPSFYDS